MHRSIIFFAGLFLLNFPALAEDESVKSVATIENESSLKSKAKEILESTQIIEVNQQNKDTNNFGGEAKENETHHRKNKGDTESKKVSENDGGSKSPVENSEGNKKSDPTSLFPLAGIDLPYLQPLDDLVLPPLPEIPPIEAKELAPSKKMINGRIVITRVSRSNSQTLRPELELRQIGGKWVICPKVH